MDILGIQLTDLPDLGNMIIKFLVNTLAIWCIIHLFYFPKSRRREYYFTFMLIGISVFFLIFLLGGVKIRIGFALGLFAIFGIIRYRTESMPVREMTYLFVIIAMSVINALSDSLSWLEIIAVNGLFILSILIFENIHLKEAMAVKMVQYDRIELVKPCNYEQMIADLKERTGLDIVKVEVGGIDFLRDMAVLKIYYRHADDNTANLQTKVSGEQWTNDIS